MAIQISGTTVIDNSRQLTNITGLDATTVATLTNAGVGGGEVTISDITTDATYYPTFTTTTNGTMDAAAVTTSKLTYNPSSGTLSSVLFQSTSDANKKTNVVTASADVVGQLRGVEFAWKETGEKSSGVIAQEVQAVLPHLVAETDNGLTVNYSGLIAYLIEANKQLATRVEALENK